MSDWRRSTLAATGSSVSRCSVLDHDDGQRLEIAVIESTLLVNQVDGKHLRSRIARAVFNVIVEDKQQNLSLVRFVSDFVDFDRRIKKHFRKCKVALPQLTEPSLEACLYPHRRRRKSFRTLLLSWSALKHQKSNSEKIEHYLKRCALDPDIGHSSLFRDFLRAQRDEDRVASKAMLESYVHQHVLEEEERKKHTELGPGYTPPVPRPFDHPSMIPRRHERSLSALSCSMSVSPASSIRSMAMSDSQVYRTHGPDDMASVDPEQDSNSDRPSRLRSNHKEGPKVSIQDFRFIKVLGKGCMGKVLLVQHQRTARLLALKAISKEWVVAQREIEHTRMERDILAKIASIRHPFLIRLHHSFQDASQLFLVLDYHVGGDLATQLAKHYRFSPERCRLYTAEILLGLQELHRLGILYRDLKPENILLGADGHVVLTDFGLSKQLLGDTDDLRTNTFCGTAEYLAPEVLRSEEYSFAVDFWSLGTILYEMLTGVTPYWAESHADMYRRVLEDELEFPEDFDLPTIDLISGLLHRDPQSRLGAGPHGPILIRSHCYFESLDWTEVYFKRIRPPYVPQLRSETDFSHFDQDFLQMSPRLSPVNDDDVLSQSLDKAFQGYSYAGGDDESLCLGSSVIDGSMIQKRCEDSENDLNHPQRLPPLGHAYGHYTESDIQPSDFHRDVDDDDGFLSDLLSSTLSSNDNCAGQHHPRQPTLTFMSSSLEGRDGPEFREVFPQRTRLDGTLS